MSRRKKELQTVSPPKDFDELYVENDSADDEIARELEEERQKILAAAGQPKETASHLDSNDGQNNTEDDSDTYGDSDVEEDTNVVDEDEDSADEWQPPEPVSKSTRRSKRGRHKSSSEDSNDEAVADTSDEDSLKPVAKKPKKAASSKLNGVKSKARAKTPRSDLPIPRTADDAVEQEAYDSFDEQAERVQAEAEAAAAWADVRRRKAAAQAQPTTTGSTSDNTATTSSNKTPQASTPSLTAWLGKGPSASSSVAELAAAVPMPTTCPAAQIADRNSLFVGYVYPLTTPAPAYISTLLSHLARVVHPTVPTDLLPPQFANAPSNKRGSSHDMYAYRVLELKRGRTGVAGPDDFSLQEDKEDDGERWGGDRVLRVTREEGAADVLVVVSRWYGGELLGPVRFEHIENAARAALVEHIAKVEVDEFRQRIQYLDRKIAKAKALVQGNEVREEVGKYEGLTVEKAQRLWLARQKALDALQKRLSSQPPPSQERDVVEQQQAASPEKTAPVQAAAASPSPTHEPTHELPHETPEGQHATVKDEPRSPDDPVSTASPQSQIKLEPAHSTLTSPPHIKDERSPSALEDADQDVKLMVKLEPAHDEGDLTGWDDLS